MSSKEIMQGSDPTGHKVWDILGGMFQQVQAAP
jgi:hypothetical protein